MGTRKGFGSRAKRSLALVAIPLLFSLSGGCREDSVPPPAPSRTVKTVTIDARASGSVRDFSGTIVASEISALAFRVGGSVLVVDVDLGQFVRRGQVLATLDRTPFQLKVQQARAEVRNAEAARIESRDRLSRTRALFEAGAASRADLDRVIAADEGAASSIASARAALDLALRDLKDTVLEAPFDGLVAEKRVDAFEEVLAGHAAFVLHTSGAVELEVVLPDLVIEQVRVGDSVSVRLTSAAQNNGTYSGRVKEVGSAAVDAGFPVIVALDSDDTRLRPGLSAVATFTFRAGDGQSWLVPINAFIPKAGEDQTAHISARELSVFVVDPMTESVSLRTVRAVGLRGNDVLVSEGLSEGDRVVAAGVSFLHDGQSVRLMDSNR